MTSQLRDVTHKLCSYTDKDGNDCEIWGIGEVFDRGDIDDDDIASYFEGLEIKS